jgi:hypothetical protein
MTRFIEEHRGRFGVEWVRRVMGSTVSTYHAHRTRPPSRRATEDARLAEQIRRVHEANYSAYGIRKLWHALRREDVDVGPDRVARLMAASHDHGQGRTPWSQRRPG